MIQQPDFLGFCCFNELARKLEEAHLLNHKEVVNVYNLLLFWLMLTVQRDSSIFSSVTV